MATLTVTTLNDDLFDSGTLADETLDDGGLSLREALALATGGDEIVFDGSLITGGNDGHLVLTNGELAITTGMTVNGDINGDGKADITVDANGAVNTRVFNVGAVTATLEGLVITGGNAAGGAGVATVENTDLTIRNSTITDNHLGGGIHNGGHLILDGVTVSDNSSTGNGGGIDSSRTTLALVQLNAINSTISNNTASGNGGGLFVGDGTDATLTNVTVFGNAASGAQGGGGVYSNSGLTLVNTTLTGNHATVNGGGVYAGNGSASSLSISNSIIAGNHAGGSGDDVSSLVAQNNIYANFIGDTLTVTTTTFGGTTVDTFGGYSLASVFRSLIEIDPDGTPGNGDEFMAGVLADNGGHVQTVALNTTFAGSPVLDRAEPDDTIKEIYTFFGGDLTGDGDTDDVFVTDARGFSRAVDVGGSPNVRDLGAFELQLAQTFEVSTLEDQDFDGGDLAAETADGGGLSLREALALADLDPTTRDTINFALALTGGIVDGVDNGHVSVDNGELIIASDVVINGDVNGDGKADIILDADNNSRVIHVTGGVSTLNALTITGGAVGVVTDGGGILVDPTAALTVNNSTIAGNEAGGVGGGIHVDGLLTLNNVLVAANTASAGGGLHIENTGTALLTNTTIYGNYADVGGGMVSDGTATLTNVTITGNAAGGSTDGFLNSATGNLTLTNSIVAGNGGPAGVDLEGAGTTTFNGHNLFSQAGVGDAEDTAGADIADIFLNTTTNIFTNVTGGQLADNGGPTPTVAIKPGGLAHNATGTVLPGDTTDADGDGNTGESLPIDARGHARDVGGVDVGAVELQNGDTYTVTTLDDEEFDGGDLAAELADGGGLSLREALALTNADRLSPDTIEFRADLANRTLTLLHGELEILGDTIIDGDVSGGAGDGRARITIDAGGGSRVFNMVSGTSTLNALVMTGGDSTGGGPVAGYGGAVSIGAYLSGFGATANVTISNSEIRNSAAIYGGGISIDTYSSLRLINSTVTGNSADIGGGIAVNDAGALTVIKSTISNNTADGLYGYGGGIAVNSGASAELTSTTISGNNAINGGGIYNRGDLTLINTTLANNVATSAGGGLYTTYCGCSNTSILNSTITGNFAAVHGGGIAHYNGSLGLTNSIIAGNRAGAGGSDLYIYTPGTVSYAGRNVFSQAGIGALGDIVETDLTHIFANVVTVDPTPASGDEFSAGELANNGGPVQTVAIAIGGVAANAGEAGDLPDDTEDLNGNADTGEDLPFDARGLARVFGSGLDIGAFELQQGSAPTQVANNGGTVNEGESADIAPSELAFTDPDTVDVIYTITTAVSVGTLFRSGVALGVGSTFTQRDIDNLRITYTHDGSETASVSFGFSVSDGLGGTANGQTFTFTVNPVDDAPVNTVPGTQEIETNVSTAIAGISIADVDAGTGLLTTTLSADHGTLTVAAAGGTTLGGNGTASVSITGTLAAINAALAAAGNVLYRSDQDFFGTDTVTVSTDDHSSTGIGGPLTDTDSFTVHLNTALVGTPGNDSYNALPGNERIDAGGGIDTITFNFRLVDAHVTYKGNAVIIDGPGGSHTLLTGFEVFNFTDGTVNNNDGSPLVDDLFYYSTYHDVWTAHADADADYNSAGWKAGRDPSAFFSTVIYLSANPDVKASGVNPLTHFDTSGWKEGRVPSLTFDGDAYLAANPDVAAAGIDPLRHYLASGYQEDRQPIAPTELVAPNGFDYVYYLANNPDVAAAHIDPFLHFQTLGWKEGRNPNALFDTNGYLNTYSDVKAANINPLDHFNQFGWKEGRDPSVNFDTTSYLSAYADVNAAHINPLTHFLIYGIHEGRSPFADGVWG